MSVFMKKSLVSLCLVAFSSVSQASWLICEPGGMARANGYGVMGVSLSDEGRAEFSVTRDNSKLEGSLPFKFQKIVNETEGVTARLFLGKVKVPGSWFREEVPLVVFFKGGLAVSAKISSRNISDSGRRQPTTSEDFIRNLRADFSCK